MTIYDQINGTESIASAGKVPPPPPEESEHTFVRLLRAETGPGELDEYLNHPLNFAGSKAVAQIIRGLTGLIGNMRYALVDIVIGLLRFTRERSNGDAGQS